MLIKNFKVSNYKSWRLSPEITFDSGINIVVGQNNSGKTALLEALSVKKGSNPHASEKSKPNSYSELDTGSTSTFTFELSKEEFYELVINNQGQIKVPCPIETSSSSDGLAIVNELIKRPQTLVIEYTNNAPGVVILDRQWHAPLNQYITCQASRAERKLVLAHSRLSSRDNSGNVLEILLANKLRDRLYLFKAERFNLGQSSITANKNLSAGAENLAQVLHVLQTSNPQRFKIFNELVSKVFPKIRQITVPPSATNHAQILIWSHDPESERDDLAIPLSESGTGIGNVLAMLYVVLNSEYPQVLLIDEPQSFLHPGAVRALIEIFKMKSEHQYILTTHSPAILSMTNAPIYQITNDGKESSVKVISQNESAELMLVLEDLGARLSDVFGADKILWVEGATEEKCFQLIVDHFSKEPIWGLSIIGVSATGDFQGKFADRIYGIYSKLSTASALIPPAVGFIFDSEQQSDKTKEDLRRRSRYMVHFLPRRMFENYLLDPESIFKTLIGVDDYPIKDLSTEKITNFILSQNPSAFTENWFAEEHGAELLDKIIKYFSDGTFSYEKIKHGTLITKKILEIKPEIFREIFDLIQKINK